MTLLPKLASEFVGTFFLVFTIGLVVLQNHPLAPLGVGFILAAMIFSSGRVSGAHFNPAVTVGIWLSGRHVVSNVAAFWYIIVQVLAALIAAMVYWALLGATFTLQPGNGFTWVDAAMVEIVFTFALVFVVLNTATTAKDTTPHRYTDFNGMAIGFTVTSAAFASGSISGCSLNPAVAVGVMSSHAMHGGGVASLHLMALYLICPLIGSLLAATVFYMVRRAEYDDDVLFAEKQARQMTWAP